MAVLLNATSDKISTKCQLSHHLSIANHPVITGSNCEQTEGNLKTVIKKKELKLGVKKVLNRRLTKKGKVSQ